MGLKNTYKVNFSSKGKGSISFGLGAMEAAMLKGSAGCKGGGGDGLEGKRKDRFHAGEDHDPSDHKPVGIRARSSSSSEQHDESKPSSPEHGDSVISNGKQASPAGLTEISSMDVISRPPQLKDFSACKLDQLESAKAEMGEMKEENERLKMILARIVKDYQSLQMQFYDIVQQEPAKNSTGSASNNDQEMEEPELVSLRLGTTPISRPKKEDQMEVLEAPSKGKDDGKPRESLTLGLKCKFDERKDDQKDPPKSESTENSAFEEAAKDEEAGGEQPWHPSKALKTQRSGEDELSQQAQVKKARVSVRARCDAPTMNDGCQWRKYGQKIAKGNPCPRAYYRCTVAAGCPVRKQVQRCAEDMSILITTYEGTHNHPLPIAATAMASTTSAAACMLMSGSSTSGRQVVGASSSVTTTSADLHGLNFGLSDNSGSRPFYLPSHSISSTPSYPTITLDLTAPPSSSPNSQFNRFSTNFSSFPRHSSTSFNFTTAESGALSSVPWSSTGNNYVSYNTSPFPYSKSQFGSFNLATTQPQDRLYPSYMPKSTTTDPPQAGLSETIAAATKVLTSDPNFRSALAAAITSIVSNGGSSSSGNAHGRGDAQLGHTFKWGEQFHSLAPFAGAATNSCAPTFLSRSSNNTPSSNQPGNFMFLPPTSLPFSPAKSASTSPVDNREHTS